MKLINTKSKDKNGKKAQSAEKAKNVLTSDSKFAIVEGYKIARTNLVFSLTAQNSNCVAVTSWSKGEGKSTATVNLSISFAKMGKRVLLIDTDLRRPNLHNLLKLKNETGVSDVIGQFGDSQTAVHRNVITNLDVLTSGAIPPNPSELLASPVFAELLENAKNEYDYVILDTPPLGVVTDTLLLKDHVGGYVLVVRERITSHGDIERALQSVKLADTKVLGFLKVGCEMRSRGYGYNKYRYRYNYNYNYYYKY
ncbi:MAG: CpsD/CapB family tyrosine-protein kinase [Ruminococcus sp.]|uniref:CpsD/CapB family tyrosine-protein kinase n=1 Tax=Ruminococcus sp. TaxID=41978 RepID=UPI0028730B79|nr:CpsD/CapB family tyrosine-protein kinase [Ruminococcus sp.]MBQ3286247.1 CpsD/CapB family tyrosine-protein kinase [Ruminococcus sp.]